MSGRVETARRRGPRLVVIMGEVEEEIIVKRIATDVQDYRPLWSSFGFSIVGSASAAASIFCALLTVEGRIRGHFTLANAMFRIKISWKRIGSIRNRDSWSSRLGEIRVLISLSLLSHARTLGFVYKQFS